MICPHCHGEGQVLIEGLCESEVCEPCQGEGIVEPRMKPAAGAMADLRSEISKPAAAEEKAEQPGAIAA